MRKDEGVFAGLLLIEALDQASLRVALRRAAEMAPEVLGDVGDAEIYQGIFALDKRIAGVESFRPFHHRRIRILGAALPMLSLPSPPLRGRRGRRYCGRGGGRHDHRRHRT